MKYIKRFENLIVTVTQEDLDEIQDIFLDYATEYSLNRVEAIGNKIGY